MGRDPTEPIKRRWWKLLGLLEFFSRVIPGLPPLKLIPAQGRFVILAVNRVTVNLRGYARGGVAEALGNHRQWHAHRDQMRPVAVA